MFTDNTMQETPLFKFERLLVGLLQTRREVTPNHQGPHSWPEPTLGSGCSRGQVVAVEAGLVPSDRKCAFL